MERHPGRRAGPAPEGRRYDGQLPEDLLHELLDAMHAHLPGVGVGLAAPQIGIPLALAVIDDPAEVTAEIATAANDCRSRRST